VKTQKVNMKFLKIKKFWFICAIINLCSINISAQNTKTEAYLFEGIIVGGYVDQGAFLNFTGPNIAVIKGNSRILIGMMPSLKFKKDSGTKQNAFVTPALGCGLTYCYKFIALQIPFYYTPKTTLQNGQWHIGAGIGLRLNAIKKTN
jgi:hypothetical protein